MRQMINGMEIDVPVEPDGSVDADTVREVAGIPQNRALILKRGDGANEFINPGEKVAVRPYEHFADAALHQRGI